MRRNLLLGAVAFAGILSTGKALAQETHFSCGIDKQRQKLIAENPQIKKDYEKLLHSYTENRVVNGKSETIRIIPIVFHVIHEYGEENISDQQVQDAVRILNEDFGKRNQDTIIVVSPFDSIIGNTHLEFRLATLDPWGNCTNGIEHVYNHQTVAADSYSKLNQWDRDKYLNIWVIGTMDDPDVAGFAHYPTDVTGTGFWRDGVVMVHRSTGSIGTSIPYRSRALTHEVGHYFGLSHTWGNNNDPGSASNCGLDDGIGDTPNCTGLDHCDLSANTCTEPTTPGNYWSFDVIDNIQNYMEYAYCSAMFTNGQSNFMNNVLDQPTSGRNNLYTAENLVHTGTSTLTPVTCIPVADFYVDVNGPSTGNVAQNANAMTACANDPILFKDASWKAGVTSWSWSFPGGNPSTSTNQNPSVTYAAPGWYNVTLTVGNSAGSDTKTVNHMIYIQGDWAEYTGPRTEDFNQNANFWITHNPEDNYAAFNRVTSGGKGNTPCFKLNNFKDVANAQMFTEDWYYNDRLGNSKDYLISPAIDLRNTSNITISFDYAYGSKAVAVADITEKLIVYSSRDCGKTWVPRATLTGADLLTAGYVGNTDFTPDNNLDWKTASFTYTPNTSDNKTKFKFEFIASDFSSNFYFDNFNISGTLGIEDNGLLSAISIAPNPVASGSDLSVEIANSEAGMKLLVMDLKGAIVSTTDVPAASGIQTVNIPMNVAKGCYILNAVHGTAKSTHRVVVY